MMLNQIRNNAWTGATIAVENATNPKVVVCAPRWKNNLITANQPNWFMNGVCYGSEARDSTTFQREAEIWLSPPLQAKQQAISISNVGIHNYGMAQLGFSLHISSNALRWDIATGAPGVFSSKGSVLLHTGSLTQSRKTIAPQIRYERNIQTDDYFGYAVTSGSYFGQDQRWFASSAPKGSNLYGKVLIFKFPDASNQKMSVKMLLNGQQHGEYFGASLATCDVNNDGKDELIVGAPLWNKEVDEGRIYIYTGKQNDVLDMQYIEGEAMGGRFGSAIACLGDIDYNGYGDIAVGAPYAEESGVVYIFNGNSNGLSKKYSQKIIGSQFSQNIRGFGISISEVRDVNGDHYSDMAIGAYLSEHAILLKSKPVVKVTVKLTYSEKKKLLRNSTYFFIDVCMSYEGIYVPKDLRINRILRIDQMHGRATFGEKGNYHVIPDTLLENQILCDQLKITLRENIQNVFDPVEVYAGIELQNNMDDQTGTVNTNFSCSSCAVINKALSKTEDLIKLPFAVDCGEDNICMSDIRITLSTDLGDGNRYVIGSVPTIKLAIETSNRGEPAYQTKAYIHIPGVLSLASVEPECTENLYTNTLEIICDIGNPLRENKTLTLELDMRAVRYDVDHVNISANIITQSEEINVIDNKYSLTLHYDVDVDIAIAGKAQENTYSYLMKGEEKQLDRIRFQHVYEVQKFGDTPVENAILIINIPTHFKYANGDVEIISINQTIGLKDGQQFYCTNMGSKQLSSALTTMNSKLENETAVLHSSKIRKNSTHAEYSTEDYPLINLPPPSRSLYINCTIDGIKCQQIECKLGSFISFLSVAKLSLTLDLQLLNFRHMINEKDIIFYVSEGIVNITEPANILQGPGLKPDIALVATTFLGSPIAEHIATWIIILSIFLGIILLILLILGLIKLGFFNRKKKEELMALKAESNMQQKIVLETTSSQEVLSQE
ncbi:hypothetical protein KM043_009972 [Ampulex compressa]|nr:hypothetical protein KM043_009972 [Ampulex compressa]